MEQFLTVGLNGLTLAALYFIVASGFTLIFGLMRTVNMAHGSLYLLGAYVGYTVGDMTGIWALGVIAGAGAAALLGVIMQVTVLARLQGDDLRQALVTIGISIIVADLLLANYGGLTYLFSPPEVITGSTYVPGLQGDRYSTYRIFLIVAAFAIGLGLRLLLSRTKLGMIIRAGIDDRAMTSALGVDIPRVFLLVFALGAGLAGLAGVIGGSALSISPGEDSRYLLASLAVVIVGGMGSLSGAAIGAVVLGLAEQYGLAYWPTYSVLITFAIMVGVLVIRPYGLRGRPA